MTQFSFLFDKYIKNTNIYQVSQNDLYTEFWAIVTFFGYIYYAEQFIKKI